MTDIETIREALEAYEELAVDMMNNVCQSMGNDVIRAQNAIRLFDELVKAEPVARVAGYPGGRCVVEPINRAAILPVGAALYFRPIACKPQEGMVMVPVDDLRAVLLLDQTKDAEQRMDARNRLVRAAKEQS